MAGLTVDVSLYPLDTLKTRLQQVSDGRPRPRPRFNSLTALRSVYAGLPSVLLGSAPSAALFFIVYDGTKSALSPESPNATAFKQLPTSTVHMIAASLGEIAACAVRVPTEVVKQRAQAGLFNGSSLATLQDILAFRQKSSGHSTMLRELYRGSGATVVREVPFALIQFSLWEYLKSSYSTLQTHRFHRQQGLITAGESAVFGSLAGAVAAGLTTPLDVLKTRIMLYRTEHGSNRHEPGVFNLCKTVTRVEGWKTWFSGMIPRVTWISIGGAVFLGTYQWAWNALDSDRRKGSQWRDGQIKYQ